MMIRLIALFLVAAQPAFALSCLRPSVERSAQEAVASDEIYRIAVGSFAYDKVDLPAGGAATSSTEISIPAVFEGRALARDGFTTPVSGEVVLVVECLGPSCGSVPADTEVLAFVRQTEDEAVLDVNACPQWIFPTPTDAQLQTVQACVLQGACPGN